MTAQKKTVLLIVITFVALLLWFPVATTAANKDEDAVGTLPQECKAADGECSNSKKGGGEDVFDVFGKWVDDMSGQASKFLKQNVFDQRTKYDIIDDPFQAIFLAKKDSDDDDNKVNVPSIQSVTETVLELTRPSTRPSLERSKSFDTLLLAARNIMPSPSTTQKSFFEAVDTFSSAWDDCKEMMESAFDHVFNDDNHRFTIVMIYYFMEREEERKTSSWKRRIHRYQKRVTSLEVLEDLHEGLYLSHLAYASSVADIQGGLQNFLNDSYELIYAKIDGFPGEPAHYLAIQKETFKKKKKKKAQKTKTGLARLLTGSSSEQKEQEETHLDIIFVVRGTKELGDVLSDALLEATDFAMDTNNETMAKAHAGIARAGQYLVDTHLETFEILLKVSGKQKLKLSLVGHSLGAGSAAIAAILFNRFDWIDATSVGYGCPALLDWEASQSTAGYITTVVNDADIVPRMSGPSVSNLLLDMMSFDWTHKAMEDAELLLDYLQERVRPIMGDILPKEKILKFFDEMADKEDRPYFNRIRKDRSAPVLVAPGNCIHLYRDGSTVGGFAATYIPCNVFNQVEFSRTFLEDHLIPSGYHYALLQLLRSTKQDWDAKFAHDLLSLPIK